MASSGCSPISSALWVSPCGALCSSMVLPQSSPRWIHSFPPGNAQNTLAQPTVWLTIALTTVVCIVPVVAFRFLKLDLKPELSDTVRVAPVGVVTGS